MKESIFQKSIIDEIKERIPGCIILKNDSSYIQGIPDLLILFENQWASLETKASFRSSHRPNQDYYVELMNKMSFSAFIFPENREDILNELEEYFLA